MDHSFKKHARRARLPLAVVAAGSLAIGGVAGGTAVLAPAFASQSTTVAAASMPPVWQYAPITPVPRGEENFRYNVEATDAATDQIIFDALPGLLEDGTAISASASSKLGSGESYDNVSVLNDQVIIDTSNYGDYDDGTISVRQVSYSFHLKDTDRTYLGGAIKQPDSGATVASETVDKLSGTPLLPVGSASWKFDVPSTFFADNNSTATILYTSDDEAADPTNGYVTVDVQDLTVTDGQVVLTDDRLPQLTEGTGYQVTIRSADGVNTASSYVGLVGELPSPTPTPTEEPTEEPTATPTDEPTPTPTEEPTEEPTATPTDEPTPTPTEEPTEEPTATPTDEPTATPTDEPTTEPTDAPEVEEPESGDQVAPGEEYLAFDSENSSVEDGTFVFTTKSDVKDGEAIVTYRTSLSAPPQTIMGTVEAGKLTITADEAFASSITDHNQLLISVKGSDGRVISALLSGADVLSLQSDIVDSRLGVRLAEAGQTELGFEIPEDFPEIAEDSFGFDLEYRTANGQPATLDAVHFAVDGDRLVLDDARVENLGAGVYYLEGTSKEASSADGAASKSLTQAAADDAGSVSTWFGLFAAAEEPTAQPTDDSSKEPTADPTEDPTDDPTSDPTDEGTPSQSSTATPPSSEQEQDSSEDDKRNDDKLADTGASSGLMLAGGVALGLVVLGAIAVALRRRGRHG